MRLLLIAGILLAGLGGFIVVKGLHFQSEGTVHVGPISGTVHEQHTIPAWFGWVAIVGGVLLVVAGSRKKR
jgi:ABC-type xylose transport system permease subunit